MTTKKHQTASCLEGRLTSSPGGLHARLPSAFSPREKQSGVRKLPRAHSEPPSAMGQILLPDPTLSSASSWPHLLRLLCGRCLAKPSHLASSQNPSLGETPFPWVDLASSGVEQPRAAPEVWLSKGGATPTPLQHNGQASSPGTRYPGSNLPFNSLLTLNQFFSLSGHPFPPP